MSFTTVIAASDVCLPTIGGLAADLLAAFDADTAIRLDLSQVAAPDLSVIQLAQSARATAARDGKDFALLAPADAPLRAVLERAGFLSHLSDADSHFWFHGDTAQ